MKNLLFPQSPYQLRPTGLNTDSGIDGNALLRRIGDNFENPGDGNDSRG